MLIKKIVIVLLFCSAATVLFVACGGTGTPSGTTSTPTIEGNTGTSGSSVAVHMSYQTFAQPSVTISKGSSITLIDDVPVPHHIANGTWDNNTAQPLKEPNAPTMDVQ